MLLIVLPKGFRDRTLREHVGALTGETPDHYTPGRMSYDLRLHGRRHRAPAADPPL
jgi:hypothetical protein